MNVNIRQVTNKDLLQLNAFLKEENANWEYLNLDHLPLITGKFLPERDTHIRILNSNPCWKELFNAQRKSDTSYCNVHLITEEGYIPIHGSFLENLSPFCASLLKQQALISCKYDVLSISLPGVKMEHLKLFLTLIYKGSVVVNKFEEESIRDIMKLLEIKPSLGRTPVTNSHKNKVVRAFKIAEKKEVVMSILERPEPVLVRKRPRSVSCNKSIPTSSKPEISLDESFTKSESNCSLAGPSGQSQNLMPPEIAKIRANPPLNKQPRLSRSLFQNKERDEESKKTCKFCSNRYSKLSGLEAHLNTTCAPHLLGLYNLSPPNCRVCGHDFPDFTSDELLEHVEACLVNATQKSNESTPPSSVSSMSSNSNEEEESFTNFNPKVVVKRLSEEEIQKLRKAGIWQLHSIQNGQEKTSDKDKKDKTESCSLVHDKSKKKRRRENVINVSDKPTSKQKALVVDKGVNLMHERLKSTWNEIVKKVREVSSDEEQGETSKFTAQSEINVNPEAQHSGNAKTSQILGDTLRLVLEKWKSKFQAIPKPPHVEDLPDLAQEQQVLGNNDEENNWDGNQETCIPTEGEQVASIDPLASINKPEGSDTDSNKCTEEQVEWSNHDKNEGDVEIESSLPTPRLVEAPPAHEPYDGVDDAIQIKKELEESNEEILEEEQVTQKEVVAPAENLLHSDHSNLQPLMEVKIPEQNSSMDLQPRIHHPNLQSHQQYARLKHKRRRQRFIPLPTNNPNPFLFSPGINQHAFPIGFQGNVFGGNELEYAHPQPRPALLPTPNLLPNPSASWPFQDFQTGRQNEAQDSAYSAWPATPDRFLILR